MRCVDIYGVCTRDIKLVVLAEPGVILIELEINDICFPLLMRLILSSMDSVIC